jgi:hypothetical protein
MRWVAIGLLVAALPGGCANTVTAPPLTTTLIFRFWVAREIARRADVRYVVALDTSGNPDDGPKPYGPWPREKAFIGWDLPFYVFSGTPGASESIFNPPVEAGNVWTRLFAFGYPGNQPAFEHWEQLLKPGTKERDHIEPRQNLVQGTDFRLVNSATPTSGSTGTPAGPGTGLIDTIELTLVLDRFIDSDQLKKLSERKPSQLEANLVIQVRPPDTASDPDVTGWKLDQWFPTNNIFFAIPLDPALPPERREALNAAPQYPQNIPPGVTQDDVTFKGYASEVKVQR